jgi:O-antigen ligase
MFPADKENNAVVKLSSAKKAFIYTAATGVPPPVSFKKASDLFIIIGFIIFIGGGVQLLIMLRGAEGFSTYEGDLPSQIIYFSVYVATLFFLILSGRRISLGLVKNFWFWLLLFWTCMSVVWSGAAWVTTRQVIALCGTTLFSVYLVNNLEIQKYIKLLAVSLLVINISSYLVIVFLPDIGIGHVVSDEWKGIFSHKNHLGKAVSLSIPVFSYLILTVKKGKWIWLLGLFSSVGLLIGSQSTAALIISLFIMMVVMIFYLAKKIPALLWATVLGSIIFLTLIPLPSTGQILEYFGKDETLTGRTPLWKFCVFMAQKKPLLGYGYGAFWLGAEGPSAQVWMDVNMGINSNHCHNGFLDVALGVGGIGFFILFITYWTAIKRSSKFLFSRMLGFQYSIYLILLLWILPYNISEQALLYRNNIFWVLFSSVVLYQSRIRLQSQ